MSVRKNITLSDELAEYFEKKSRETGISQSALMVMAISEYLDQKKAMESLSDILNQMKKLENMNKQWYNVSKETNVSRETNKTI